MEFVIPNLGDGVDKADVARVMVHEGEMIAIDQPVLELETDKATVEVPSTVAGKITAVKVKQGEKVKPGQLVLVVEAAAASAPAPKAEAPRTEAPKAEAPKAAAPKAAEPAPAPSKVVDIASMTRPAAPVTTAASNELQLAIPVPAAPSVRRYARELGVDITKVDGTEIGRAHV